MRKIDALKFGRRDGFSDIGHSVAGWGQYFDLKRFRVDAGPARKSWLRIPEFSIAPDEERISDLGGPVHVRVHHLQHGRKWKKRVHARIARQVISGAGARQWMSG